MGGNSLFFGLPPPSSGAPPAPSTDSVRPKPAPAGPSILSQTSVTKRPVEKTNKSEPKRVRFHSNEVEASEEQLLGAISRIASHIGNPSKFSKASKLAIQVLQAGIKSPDVADAYFRILKAAMTLPARAVDAKIWADYHTFFKEVKESVEVFDSSQQVQISNWELWAVLANEFRTDDTYVFSKAASRVRQLIDSLPEVSEEDEVLADQPESELRDESVTDAYDRGANSSVFAVDSELVEPVSESDPFGLNALLPRPTKREEKARRRKEAEAASRKAHDYAARILREQRDGLLTCLELAAEHYKVPWAQTMIDILVKHAYDNKSKFTTVHRQKIEQLWLLVREQQSRRKQGKGGTGKLDVTPFELLQSQYANEKISIRRAVGSSGERSAEQWLG